MDTLQPGDADALADAVAASFEERHGRRPDGVWVAPGRVNLIGEHVDYNGGLCLPMALPHATYAAVGARSDDAVTAASAQQDEAFTGRLGSLGPGDVSGWPAYAAGVVWAMREDGWEPPGLDVVVDSRVPVGAGLSSSAALECSVALAVAELTGGERARDGDDLRASLTRDCMRAESEVAGANTGGLDQTIALFGQDASALLLDCRDWSRRQVPWDPAAAGLTLLVVDTRAEHSHATGGYGSRRKSCEDAARLLHVDLLRDVLVADQDDALARLDGDMRRRVRHVFTEIARVEQAVAQLEAGDTKGLGATMTASHESLRDDFEVSCAELDVVVDVALAHGALGARMTGGGFGGSAIALVPTDAVDEVGEAVTAAYADRGWPAPGLLTATPSAGARRLV